jgi:hypothetical protein
MTCAVPLAGVGLAVLAGLLVVPAHAQSIEELQADAAVVRRAVQGLDRADAALLGQVAKIPPNSVGNDFPVESVAALLKGWRSYTALECRLIGAATGANGPARGSFAAICEARRYAARVVQVDKVTACLVALIESEGRDPGDCLKPLVPLRVEGDFDA